MTPEFQEFPKMGRLFRDMVVTEKIDGTNAAVIVTEDGEVHAQSRKRIITPGKATDNFGFAGWVHENAEGFRDLGPGYHYGEWYGLGIQRGYGLSEKRFALFNPDRYAEVTLPDRVDLVPVIARSTFSVDVICDTIDLLRELGSKIAPGFMDPEGIIVYHTGARTGFKFTLDGDGHKGNHNYEKATA